jgi:hypothetical protein
MKMKPGALFIAISLMVTSAQAGVFKCQTAEGIKYSEIPCPSGSTTTTVRSISVADPQQPPVTSTTATGSGINDINAVPLPVPDKQRRGYEKFLSSPKPRAFLICTDRSVVSFTGQEQFIKKKIAEMAPGCRPYAIDDSVVW